MKQQFNEVFELCHQARELALKAQAIAKESALVVSEAKRVFEARQLLNGKKEWK